MLVLLHKKTIDVETIFTQILLNFTNNYKETASSKCKWNFEVDKLKSIGL